MIVSFAAALFISQDVPVEIAKAELPKTAICVICSLQGETEQEKPVAGVRYKGKAFYFCNKSEVAEFKKDPEGFMPPVIPRAAAEINAVLLDGTKVSLADYKGKVVLIDFWATWCKPCVKSMPAVEKMFAARKDKGFVALGISIDEDPKKVPPFLKKNTFTYPILLDTAKDPTWAAYRVKSVPAMFLVDRSGQIVAQWSGEPKMKDVEAAIDKALAKQ